MAEVVTYKNDSGRCFCQLKFENGERVLISIAGQPEPSIAVIRLTFGGMIPRETVWEVDATEGLQAMTRRVIAMFGSDENPFTHPLDSIRDALLPCGSISQAVSVLRKRESEA